MLVNVPAHFRATLIDDLDSAHAKKVNAACFVDGPEDEHRIDFFRLWGNVVRRHYSRSSTVTKLQYVKGESLELFNATFPA